MKNTDDFEVKTAASTVVTVDDAMIKTAVVTSGTAGSGIATVKNGSDSGAIKHVTVSVDKSAGLSNGNILHVTLVPDSGYTIASGAPTTKTVTGLKLRSLAAPKLTVTQGTATGESVATWAPKTTGVTIVATYDTNPYVEGTSEAVIAGKNFTLTNTVTDAANTSVTSPVSYSVKAADIKS